MACVFQVKNDLNVKSDMQKQRERPLKMWRQRMKASRGLARQLSQSKAIIQTSKNV